MIVTNMHDLLEGILDDFFSFIDPFLARTQFLVAFFRLLGARIGQNVILPSIACVTEPHLVAIGDHVRLHAEAYLQVIM